MEDQTIRPLAKRQLFHSYDLDEARMIVSEKFCAHRLERTRSDDQFDALHNHAAGRAISLNYLRYGADVVIEPGELTSFYLLQIPIRGAAEIMCGDDHLISHAGCASLLNPQRHTRMRWNGDCEQLLVQIDRRALEAVAERLIDKALPIDLVFDCAVDLARPDLRKWMRGIFGLFQAATTDDAFSVKGSMSQAAIEQDIMEGIIRLQPNSISHRLERSPVRMARSTSVRAAMALIRDDLSSSISIADVASTIGVSERALQLGFKNEVGISPKQFLTQERLLGAHEEIISSDRNVNIGDIARRWGFAHVGRFSSTYQRHFGVLPRSRKRY